jgi:hypothetical protein
MGRRMPPKLHDTNSPVLALVRVMTDRCAALGLEVETNPEALRHEEHRAADLFKALGTPIPSTPPLQLASRSFLIAGVYFVRLLELPGALEEEAADGVLASLRIAAAVDRSHMAAPFEHDLYYFLVGSAGTDEHVLWYRFAHRVARDEHACRKLVWLPSARPAEWVSSAQRFLTRTFLARPWRSGNSGDLPDLDLVRRIADRAKIQPPAVQAMISQALTHSSAEDIAAGLLDAVRDVQ